MDNVIIHRALEAELARVCEELSLTNDEYAVVYYSYPESHVFYRDECCDEDHESMLYVMDRDVQVKIGWLTTTIAQLCHRDVRGLGGLLEDCEGVADMMAEYAAERRAGC